MRYWLPLVWMVMTTFALQAQRKEDILEEARTYIAAEHYRDALRTFERSKQVLKTDTESRFLRAVCLYQVNQLEEAIQLLEALVKEEKTPWPECWWYIGRIYHARHQFSEAASQYKRYLLTLGGDHPNRAMVIEAIRRCDNGLRLLHRPAEVVVENMGNAVNTEGDEFAPVLSPNYATRLYFTAARQGNVGGPRNRQMMPDEQFGHFTGDMFVTRLQGGKWLPAEAMHSTLNTPQHEQLMGFSANGQVMLYFQGWTTESGEIFADTFQQASQRALTIAPFLSPLSPRQGDLYASLYNDTLLIFASRRPGGFGGLDLYRTALRNGA
ncbi:MAG: tetratricopeptide repeat protein [Saprospiraceae bacterium]